MAGVEGALKELRHLASDISNARSRRYGGAPVREVLAREPEYVVAIQHRKSKGKKKKAHATLKRQLALGRVGRAVQVPRTSATQLDALLATSHYLTCYAIDIPLPGLRMLGDDQPARGHPRTVQLKRLTLPPEVAAQTPSTAEVGMREVWPRPKVGTLEELFAESVRILDPGASDDQVEADVRRIEAAGPLTGRERLRILKRLDKSLGIESRQRKSRKRD